MDLLIYNGTILNDNGSFTGSILVSNGRIKQIFPGKHNIPSKIQILDATGKFILPGAIDTHVHFREPGLTHKATIRSESHAALAGGVTSFLDMPNTLPPTTGEAQLYQKLKIASRSSAINYGFYIAATKDNLLHIKDIPHHLYPGIKIFYAPSTGNLLCNDHQVLEQFFTQIDKPFVIHSEDLQVLQQAQQECKNIPRPLPAIAHLLCRPAKACYQATERLIKLANQTQAKVHFLHITTKEEIQLLASCTNKNITAEVCPHYLWFNSEDYQHKGNLIKVNPSIKTPDDRQALIAAVKDKTVDTIGTDHAPHLLKEKNQPYTQAPSGAPSIQHFYPVIFQIFENNNIPLELIPYFTAHRPAQIFRIRERGFIKQGYWADIAIIEKQKDTNKILHKCGWSVFQDQDINYRVFATIINGQIAWINGNLHATISQPLEFL